MAAMENAAKGHSDKRQADRMMADKDVYAESVIAAISSGEYKNQIK